MEAKMASEDFAVDLGFCADPPRDENVNCAYENKAAPLGYRPAPFKQQGVDRFTVDSVADPPLSCIPDCMEGSTADPTYQYHHHHHHHHHHQPHSHSMHNQYQHFHQQNSFSGGMYPQYGQGSIPPVMKLSVYPPMLFGNISVSGNHLMPSFGMPVNHHAPPAPPTQNYSRRARGVATYFAFENLPDEVPVAISDRDCETISRSMLREMTSNEIEREEDFISPLRSFQLDDPGFCQERQRVIRWVAHRVNCWGLSRHTFFLAIAYLDKYLSTASTYSPNLLREGAACLRWACKMEEVTHPPVDDFLHHVDPEFTLRDLQELMDTIIDALGWQLSVPNTYLILKLFIQHTNAARDGQLQSWAMYLAELSMMEASTVRFPPSIAAIACLTVALAKCHAVDYTKAIDVLKSYRPLGSTEQLDEDVRTFIQNLVQLQHEAASQAVHDAHHYLRPVVERFASIKLGEVSRQAAFDWNLSTALMSL